MAISRKTNDAPKGVNLDHLKKLVERIEAKQSKATDARADLGSLFKEAEDTGLNRAALKLAIKLRNMEPDKRNDFTSSLHAYCDFLGVWTQGDLFEDAPNGIGPEQRNGATEADPIGEARTAGLKDGAEGKTNFDQYEEGSPAHLAYKAAWEESQAAAVSGMGEKPNGRSRRGSEAHGHA